MPLVRNTGTSKDSQANNRHLEKINTGGDACANTAIRSYYKVTIGTTPGYPAGTTTFTLPFIYAVGSHTLWIYVNGQKAELEVSSAGAIADQWLQYGETDNTTVTFWYSGGFNTGDIIEFLVAGSYIVEDPGAIIQDLTDYKTVRDDLAGSTHFQSSQAMGGYKFTGLGTGTGSNDSIARWQLGSNFNSSEVHFHDALYDSTGGPTDSTPLIQATSPTALAVNATLDMNSSRILDVGTPTAGGDATNKTYVDAITTGDATNGFVTFPGNIVMLTGQVTFTGWGTVQQVLFSSITGWTGTITTFLAKTASAHPYSGGGAGVYVPLPPVACLLSSSIGVTPGDRCWITCGYPGEWNGATPAFGSLGGQWTIWAKYV